MSDFKPLYRTNAPVLRNHFPIEHFIQTNARAYHLQTICSRNQLQNAKTESLQTLRLIVYYSYQAPNDTIIRAILLFSSDFCFLKFSPLNRIGAHLSSIRS